MRRLFGDGVDWRRLVAADGHSVVASLLLATLVVLEFSSVDERYVYEKPNGQIVTYDYFPAYTHVNTDVVTWPDPVALALNLLLVAACLYVVVRAVEVAVADWTGRRDPLAASVPPPMAVTWPRIGITVLLVVVAGLLPTDVAVFDALYYESASVLEATTLVGSVGFRDVLSYRASVVVPPVVPVVVLLYLLVHVVVAPVSEVTSLDRSDAG